MLLCANRHNSKPTFFISALLLPAAGSASQTCCCLLPEVRRNERQLPFLSFLLISGEEERDTGDATHTSTREQQARMTEEGLEPTTCEI